MPPSTKIQSHKPLRAREALRELSERLPEMKRRFDVSELIIFGSVARDEARIDSDLDMLVTFVGTPTFANFMGLKIYLEDLFGVSVDLGIRSDIRPALRSRIEQDSRYVS